MSLDGEPTMLMFGGLRRAAGGRASALLLTGNFVDQVWVLLGPERATVLDGFPLPPGVVLDGTLVPIDGGWAIVGSPFSETWPSTDVYYLTMEGTDVAAVQPFGRDDAPAVTGSPMGGGVLLWSDRSAEGSERTESLSAAELVLGERPATHRLVQVTADASCPGGCSVVGDRGPGQRGIVAVLALAGLCVGSRRHARRRRRDP